MKNFKNNTDKPYQAIVLAGGLGARLRSSVNDVPKCMAPVAGKPFLHYVINYLQAQGVGEFIFSLGYMSEHIEQFLQHQFHDLSYDIVIEKYPLGTGGAILLACNKATQSDILIVNGDTLFKVAIPSLVSFHAQQKAACTLSLKSMQNFDRYGVVEINNQSMIQSFNEKKFYEQGLINGGVYVLNKQQFLSKSFPEKFSFEKDYLEKYVGEGIFAGVHQNGYFIDIGIPADFNRAQEDFRA